MINKVDISDKKRNSLINEINLYFSNAIKNIHITISNITGKKQEN